MAYLAVGVGVDSQHLDVGWQLGGQLLRGGVAYLAVGVVEVEDDRAVLVFRQFMAAALPVDEGEVSGLCAWQVHACHLRLVGEPFSLCLVKEGLLGHLQEETLVDLVVSEGRLGVLEVMLGQLLEACLAVHIGKCLACEYLDARLLDVFGKTRQEVKVIGESLFHDVGISELGGVCEVKPVPVVFSQIACPCLYVLVHIGYLGIGELSLRPALRPDLLESGQKQQARRQGDGLESHVS